MAKSKLIIWVAVLIIIIAGIYWYVKANTDTEVEQVACTMDAKLCPDGSYVGRIGPNCEFAMCPGEIGGEVGGSQADEGTMLP